MARVQTVVCDRCKAKDDDIPVLSWSGKRGNAKVQGDLCQPCWDELMKLFRPDPIGRGRHHIVMTDPATLHKNQK